MRVVFGIDGSERRRWPRAGGGAGGCFLGPGVTVREGASEAARIESPVVNGLSGRSGVDADAALKIAAVFAGETDRCVMDD